jgi:hypothetical protein
LYLGKSSAVTPNLSSSVPAIEYVRMNIRDLQQISCQNLKIYSRTPRHSDTGGGGAIDSFAPAHRPRGLPIYVARFPSTPFINPPLTLPMLIDQGSAIFSSTPKPPLRYRWISLPQIPEMFLKHLWISEDQRFFQHEGFDWKEMDLAVKEPEGNSSWRFHYYEGFLTTNGHE